VREAGRFVTRRVAGQSSNRDEENRRNFATNIAGTSVVRYARIRRWASSGVWSVVALHTRAQREVINSGAEPKAVRRGIRNLYESVLVWISRRQCQRQLEWRARARQTM